MRKDAIGSDFDSREAFFAWLKGRNGLLRLAWLTFIGTLSAVAITLSFEASSAARGALEVEVSPGLFRAVTPNEAVQRELGSMFSGLVWPLDAGIIVAISLLAAGLAMILEEYVSRAFGSGGQIVLSVLFGWLPGMCCTVGSLGLGFFIIAPLYACLVVAGTWKRFPSPWARLFELLVPFVIALAWYLAAHCSKRQSPVRNTLDTTASGSNFPSLENLLRTAQHESAVVSALVGISVATAAFLLTFGAAYACAVRRRNHALEASVVVGASLGWRVLG